MKSITINSHNAKWIASRLNRFFGSHHLVTYHQWDCGMKKRIGKIMKGDPYSSDPETRSSFDTTMAVFKASCSVRDSISSDEVVISINESLDQFEDYDAGYILKEGDKVAFLGNRVIFRIHYPLKMLYSYQKYDYLYVCYQIDDNLEIFDL